MHCESFVIKCVIKNRWRNELEISSREKWKTYVVPRECRAREEDQDDETQPHSSNRLRDDFHD